MHQIKTPLLSLAASRLVALIAVTLAPIFTLSGQEYTPLGSGTPHQYNGIPFQVGGVHVVTYHWDSAFVPTGSFQVNGQIAARVHIMQCCFWADNVPDGVTVGNIVVHHEDSTLERFDLVVGQNTAEWAYDRPEIQACLQSTKVPPAYSYWTNQDSHSYYWGHLFYVSFSVTPTPLDRLELILDPAAYTGQLYFGCSPADWFGIDMNAVTLEAPSTLQCADLTFRPDQHGWQFANNTDMWPYTWSPGDPLDERCSCGSGPVARCFPTWALFRDAFGVEQTEFPSGRRRSNAEEKWNSIKGCWKGSCFGFATSSILFFDGFLDLQVQFPGNSRLYQVPLSDNSRWLVNKYWIYQFGLRQYQHISSNLTSTTPKSTLQACRKMFNTSIRDDQVLVLFNNHGSGGHAVNPYRCEVDASDSDLTYIYVYDNNYPGADHLRITVNTAANTWSYPLLSTWGGDHGLFLMDPISNYTSNPVQPRSIPPRERWISSETNSPSQYVEIFVRDAHSVNLQSSLGGIGHVGDSLFNSLYVGMPIIPITGQETSPIGYYVPNVGWTIHTSDARDSVLSITVFTDSIVMCYFRSDVDSTQGDWLSCDSDGRTLRVHNPTASEREFDYEFIVTQPDSEITIQAQHFGLSPVDSAVFSGVEDAGLQIENFGDSTTYRLVLEVAGTTNDRVFYQPEVAIKGHTSHLILPTSWSSGDYLLVLVDVDMTGVFSDTLCLHNISCGDADGEGTINIADAVYLIAYIFSHGPAPVPLAAGDADCDGSINIADCVYLINYIFSHGPAPCEGCK
jgi:hypothetical protein